MAVVCISRVVLFALLTFNNVSLFNFFINLNLVKQLELMLVCGHAEVVKFSSLRSLKCRVFTDN